MKKSNIKKHFTLRYTLIFIFLLLSKVSQSQNYSSFNISMHARYQDSVLISETEPDDQRYNSVWGYYDSINQKEYAILGGINGTYFIDVTQPENPKLKDYIEGKRSDCIWREYKNYGKYLYVISDDKAPNSLQIIDMSYLPDSAHLVYDSDELFSRAHTLYIEGDKMYCAAVKTSTNIAYSMAVYSLENPESPKFISALNTDYPGITWVHDMLVKNDTIFASCGYDGLNIYQLKENNHFEMLGSLTSYPDKGYNHSSSITENGKTMVFTDEVPEGMAVKVLDITNLADLKVTGTFKSHKGATAHNPHIVKNKAVISYYMDGIWIYDVSYADKPTLVGYFDSYPQNGNNYSTGSEAYKGCWGVYPYLPSGIILASDMQNGLFILNADAAYNMPIGIKENHRANQTISVYPNPFSNEINIKFDQPISGNIKIIVEDFLGKSVFDESYLFHGESKQEISLKNNLNQGFYSIKIIGGNFQETKKLIKK